MSEALLTEIRDLLAEQNRQMARIIEMNENSMQQGAAAYAHSLAAAGRAEDDMQHARRQSRLGSVLLVVVVLIAAVGVWLGCQRLAGMFGF